MDLDYEAKKRKEIEQYRSIENIHELPAIFHYWSNKYLLPLFQESGISSIEHLYAKYFFAGSNQNSRFISIGAGYCDTEIRIAKMLKEMGLRSFTFECLEFSPQLIARGKEIAIAEGVAEHMLFTEADFNTWKPTTTYSGIMANHSLHHVVNLEGLFDNIKRALEPSSYFVTSDMIGRNGHQRWPEALEIVNDLWQQMPESYRYNQLLKRHESEFINWDCSSEGFEGIRAQDILPLLIKRFNFKLFIGFSNVVSTFIDRAFGHNFNASDEWDLHFIDRIQAIDEKGFKSGKLKPTQMLAVMTSEQVSAPIYARGLTPQMSVRIP